MGGFVACRPTCCTGVVILGVAVWGSAECCVVWLALPASTLAIVHGPCYHKVPQHAAMPDFYIHFRIFAALFGSAHLPCFTPALQGAQAHHNGGGAVR